MFACTQAFHIVLTPWTPDAAACVILDLNCDLSHWCVIGNDWNVSFWGRVQPIYTTGWASRFRVMTVSVNLFFNFFLFVCSVELIDFWCVHFIGLKCEFGVFFRVCCFQTCKMKKKKIILVEYWNLLIKKKYQKLYFKIFYLNILVKFLLWSCLPWNLYKQSFKKAMHVLLLIIILVLFMYVLYIT